MFSDDKKASDLVNLDVLDESVLGLAVERWSLITFTAFENVAQFCNISPLICQVFSKGILQISLDLELCSPKGAS